MNRPSDHLHNLADALSEDVVAMSPEMRAAEVAPEGSPGLARAFDRVVGRAERQARWRRLGQRLRALAPSTTLRSWRPAVAAVAGIAVVVVVGDVFLQGAGGPRAVPASVERFRVREPVRNDILASRRLADRDESAGGVPAAAPAASPSQPAPAAGASADAPKRVPTVPMTAATEAANPPQPLAPSDKPVRILRVRPAAEAPPPAPAKPAPDVLDKRSLSLADPPLSRAAPDARLQSAPRVAASPPAAAAVDQAGANRNAIPAFAWPVGGHVMADFATAKADARAAGIDIAVPLGTDVRAAADGAVVYAGDGIGNFGNLILVRHDGGFVTAYAHLGRILVKVNDRVQRGQVIATSGSSDTAATPLLHFEIRRGSATVDAWQFLPAR